jgi:hypothetical protein
MIQRRWCVCSSASRAISHVHDDVREMLQKNDATGNIVTPKWALDMGRNLPPVKPADRADGKVVGSSFHKTVLRSALKAGGSTRWILYLKAGLAWAGAHLHREPVVHMDVYGPWRPAVTCPSPSPPLTNPSYTAHGVSKQGQRPSNQPNRIRARVHRTHTCTLHVCMYVCRGRAFVARTVAHTVGFRCARCAASTMCRTGASCGSKAGSGR